MLQRFVPHSARSKAISGVIGVMAAGAGAFAATNWIVGLNSGSNAESRSGSVSNLTISAVASPVPTNLLYPGASGDAVVTITNPNSFPVTVTAVNLPTSTTYAAGYTTSALTTAQSGCSATTSDVAWNYATTSSGSSHTLNAALVVAANASLTVTFTNDSSMTTASPANCESTYFSMPSLTGVTATAGGGTATTSPATDYWNS